MTTNNGGPAFPGADANFDLYKGMTLRDYMAAKAMQGIFASERHSTDDGALFSFSVAWYESVACHAYSMADSMLKAKEKGGTK